MPPTLAELLSGRGAQPGIADIISAAGDHTISDTAGRNFAPNQAFGTAEGDLARGLTSLTNAYTGSATALTGPAVQAGLAQLLKSIMQGGSIDPEVLNEQLRASDRGTQAAQQDAAELSARTGGVGPGGAIQAALGEAGLRRNAAIETAEQERAQARLSERLGLLGNLAINPALNAGGIQTGANNIQAQIDAATPSTFDKILGTIGTGVGAAGQAGLFASTGGASAAIPALGGVASRIGGNKIGM